MGHEAGLHARPLAMFVKLARQFDAEIWVSNLSREMGPVPGNSAIKLMQLAVTQGHEMRIETTGPQAEQALTALTSLIENNFQM